MTSVPLSLCTVMVCFLTLQSSSASPLFSVGGDKPTPIRYTFRVERLEFGDSENDDDFDDSYDWEECPEEEYHAGGDEEDEEDYPEIDEDEDEEDYYETDEDEEEEENPETDEDEENSGIDDVEEEDENPGVDEDEEEEEYPGIDEDQEEEETPPEYYEEEPSIEEEYPGIEDEEEIIPDDTSTEGFPAENTPYPDVYYPYYPYPDDVDSDEDLYTMYYDDDYDQEEDKPSTEQEIITLPSVKKRQSHRHRVVGQKRNINHLPTLMRAIRHRAVAARPHKTVANRPLSPKRHQLKRRQRPQGHIPV